MKYLIWIKYFALFFLLAEVYAQPVQIQGTVYSSDEKIPLPGVSILILGSNIGTITDMNGAYILDVESGKKLQFSYVGYTTREIVVGSKTILNVELDPDVSQLKEVVVTSLGIEREVKALGYSISDLSGDKLTEAREINFTNGLKGRVAGVNVTSVAGGPASSTRVIIRGNASLNGDNQPLYVVDGIPMVNENYGQAGIWGGQDQGDGLTSISPDDIASIEVLKGASAAALYGARAANGVINITTKKGSVRKGVGVEFHSNYMLESIYDLRDYQREYGQGDYVRQDPSDHDSPFIAVAPRDQEEGLNWNNRSWGPKLGSGTFVAFDGKTRTYEDRGNQWPNFFQKGMTWSNTLAMSGGNPKQNFRISISDLINSSVVPNSGYHRLNGSLMVNSKFGEKLILTAKIMYSNERVQNRPRLSDSPGNTLFAMHLIPANLNVDWYRGDPNKLGAVPEDQDSVSLSLWNKKPGEELPAGENQWQQNPWWATYQLSYEDIKDRIIASAQLGYDITDFIYIQGRVGMDWSVRRDTRLWPQGTSYFNSGNIWELERRYDETNMEYRIGYDDAYGKFSLNAFLGGNMMRKSYNLYHIIGSGFNVPFFSAINNTIIRNQIYEERSEGINSIFGQIEIGYDGFVYLTGTARNDWFSVLNPAYNSIFYPSLGISLVFTDLISALPSWLAFGKVRASWAQVGSVTVGPYETIGSYSFSNAPHLGYQAASFSNAMGGNGDIPNPELRPLLSTEWELGTDIRLLNDRLGIDLTYYNQATTDDILNGVVSKASGFARTKFNVGKITNDGVEVLLYGKPLAGSFSWDVSLNLAKNNNKVVELIEGSTEMVLEEPRTRSVYVKHIVGYPYGMLTGWVQKKTPDGRLLYEENGAPVRSDKYEIIGYGVPKLTGGLENTMNWKGINLSFLIDFKYGSNIYSGTDAAMTNYGYTKLTLQGREESDPLIVTGAIQTDIDSQGQPVYEDFEYALTPLEAKNYWRVLALSASDRFTYDASFIKLRQLVLGYNFPANTLRKTPFTNVSISFVGRNLWIIYKNTPNMDPEVTYTNSNSQGLDYFAMPAVRSYGFNLKVAF